MLPLGWHTDLAVRRLDGSTIEEHDDHVVVRTPSNPLFYWGNFVLVTDPDTVDDADHWLAVFERTFPSAAHRAIGMAAEPAEKLTPSLPTKYRSLPITVSVWLKLEAARLTVVVTCVVVVPSVRHN